MSSNIHLNFDENFNLLNCHKNLGLFHCYIIFLPIIWPTKASKLYPLTFVSASLKHDEIYSWVIMLLMKIYPCFKLINVLLFEYTYLNKFVRIFKPEL